VSPTIFKHLRIFESKYLIEYLVNTAVLLKYGNKKFLDYIAKKENSKSGEYRFYKGLITKPFVLQHSWLPGYIQLSKMEMLKIKSAMGLKKDRTDQIFISELEQSFKEVGWAPQPSKNEMKISSLVQKTTDIFVAIQNRRELTRFLENVAPRKPKVVVEIGTARGGVFYALAQVAHDKATLVSIDLPGGSNCGGQTENERKVFSCFGKREQSIHFLPGNSQHITTKRSLKQILGKKKVDLLFIDGDHSYGGVASDLRMYREFLSKDALVVFHDICVTSKEFGPGNEVGEIWAELKKHFYTYEIVDSKGLCKMKVPRNRIRSWGIGLIEMKNETNWKRLRYF
jgi:predicted O-methyltransferase YrrM